MELFTMKYEHQKHRMALDAVLAEHGGPEIRMVCVAHRKDETTGEMLPNGLALEGAVPVKNLIRWATRKGFLKWQRAEATSSVPVPETTPESEVPKAKTRKVSKPAAKKPAKTPKERKNARTGRAANRRGAKSVSAASSRR
jgi:hypothetical protein